MLAVPFFTEEQYRNHLVMMPDWEWFYPKKRKLSKAELDRIRPAMERYLTKEGYTYAYDFAKDTVTEQ